MNVRLIILACVLAGSGSAVAKSKMSTKKLEKIVQCQVDADCMLVPGPNGALLPVPRTNGIPSDSKMLDLKEDYPRKALCLKTGKCASASWKALEKKLVETGGPCSCDMGSPSEVVCLYHARGDTFKIAEEEEEKLRKVREAGACQGNEGCRPGSTKVYFFCDHP